MKTRIKNNVKVLMMTEGEKKKKQKKSTDDNEDKINDVKEVLMTIRKEIKTKIQ